MSESTFGGRGCVSCLWAPLANSKQKQVMKAILLRAVMIHHMIYSVIAKQFH